MVTSYFGIGDKGQSVTVLEAKNKLNHHSIGNLENVLHDSTAFVAACSRVVIYLARLSDVVVHLFSFFVLSDI